ncbi:MAG: hypothetical protein ACE15E_01735 [Acidobacteriota bacterium]
MLLDQKAHDQFSSFGFSASQKILLVGLRMAIGWHLLYEGVAKLLISGWTSADYLQTATGIFAGVFRWLASAPLLLKTVDLVNIWGLILIGLALLLGCGTRLASLFGVCLIALYYLAHPSLIGTDFRLPVEGHYLFVNKNVVELAALLVFAFFPMRALWGIDQLLLRLRRMRAGGASDQSLASPSVDLGRPPVPPLGRRQILANLAALPILGAFFYGVRAKHRFEKNHAITGATIKAPDARLDKLSGKMPTGKIGHLEISRLILGSNLIAGAAHTRDLIYGHALFRAYNTERKIIETLELAERAGVNTLNLVNFQYPIFHKYLELTSGKMQTICQTFPKETDLKTDIDKAVDNGATTIYIQGAIGDRFIRTGKIDLLAKALEHIKRQGYLAGIGAHSIQVPIACEKAGLDPDYYVKTLHQDDYWSAHPRENRFEFEVGPNLSEDHNQYHDSMFDLFPEKTIEFMAQVKKPWIAFKILAGGAIHPKRAFKHAFQNGADFICVGMFDFQIIEDVNIALDAFNSVTGRERAWMA